MDIEKRRISHWAYYQRNKEARKAYSKKHHQEHQSRDRITNRILQQKRKVGVLSYYSLNGSPQCVRCGITDLDVLCIDHINEDGYKQRQSNLVPRGSDFYRWLTLEGFPEGYQTLCANCNLKKNIQVRRKKTEVNLALLISREVEKKKLQ